MKYLETFKGHRIGRTKEVVNGMRRIVGYYDMDIEDMLTADVIASDFSYTVSMIYLRPCRNGFEVEVVVGPESRQFVSETFSAALLKYEFCVECVENKLRKMFDCDF